MDCIFCKIANKDIPSEFLYESDAVMAFNDINPLAPVHILIVPKKHIVSINDCSDPDFKLMEEIFRAAKQLAYDNGLSESGYRVFTNTGDDSGQVVKHLHFHLVGGQKLTDGV